MLGLVAAALAVLLFGFHTYGPVTGSTGISADSDAAFHARRLIRTIESGALLPPAQDPFENFPDGGAAVWPPLHDAALVLLARAGGSTAEEPARGIAVASALPVLQLLLALAVAAALAWRRGSVGAAALTAGTIALTPFLLRRTAYGEIDHNAADVLFGVLLVAAGACLWEKPPPGGRAAQTLALGTLVLTALGFFPGLVLVVGCVALAVAVADFTDGGERVATFAAGLLIASAILPWLASARAPADPGDPWRLGAVYGVVLALGAMAASGAGLCARRGRIVPARDWLPLATFAGGTALVLVAPRADWQGIFEGFGFLGARDPWLATIEEFQPLLGRWDLLRLSLPALAVALVAVAVAGATRTIVRRDLVILVPFGAYVALALVQRRFLAPAIAFGALCAGVLFAAGGRLARRAILATFAVGALAVLPTLGNFLAMYARGAQPLPAEPADVAAGMVARSTPQPSDPPEWGVLAPWGFGHRMLWISGRAVATNNFGAAHPGFERALRILLEPSPRRALEELRALRIRYVLTVRAPLHVPTTAAAVGDDPNRFYDGIRRRSLLAEGAPRRPALHSLLHRLHEQDGRPRPADRAEDREALSRFVLIDQSPQTYPAFDGRRVPFLKLFEVR